MEGKFALKVGVIVLSYSLAQTVLKPAFLNPRSNPPAPEKRETRVGADLDFIFKLISCIFVQYTRGQQCLQPIKTEEANEIARQHQKFHYQSKS